MDIGVLLQTMRDPAGIPSHPIIFQVLYVVTWILHIAFVHLTLGAGALAIFSFTKRQSQDWERLSIAMTKVAKVSVSLAIVLGVAPLLFTQVIYDPQWYASNVLSASWAIGFIFTLIIAYSLWFAFYFKNHEGASGNIIVFALIAFGLFLLDGFIMHALTYQSLLPEQWMNWYAPNGIVDNSGSKLHAWQWQRFAYIILLSMVMVGAYLMAYADYFRARSDKDGNYLAWVRGLGVRIAVAGTAISLPLMLLWYIDLPAHVASTTAIPFIVLAGVTAYALVFFWSERNNRFDHGYRAFLVYGAIVAVLSAIREIARIAYMKPFNYDIMTYKVVADWPSFTMFLLTFLILGGLVGGFYLASVYKAGRVVGEYSADASVAKLGNRAVGIIVVWIAIFFAIGIWTWLGNKL